MQEDVEETHHQEQAFQDEEPARVVPPLLHKDLDGFGFENRQILSLTELLGQLERHLVLTGREPKPTSEYLSEVLLPPMVPPQVSLEPFL